MEHTKGELTYRPYLAPDDQWLIAGVSATAKNQIAKMLDRGEKGKANAARLVKCWNEYDGLVEALKKYGDHIGACHANLRMGKCNCGFDQAIAKVEQS